MSLAFWLSTYVAVWVALFLLCGAVAVAVDSTTKPRRISP